MSCSANELVGTSLLQADRCLEWGLMRRVGWGCLFACFCVCVLVGWFVYCVCPFLCLFIYCVDVFVCLLCLYVFVFVYLLC